MKKQYLVTLIALVITGSLVYAYQLNFKRRWPGKHSMDIHASWGRTVHGKTGFFNDEATLELTHPIDRLRILHANGYQLKVYDSSNFISEWRRTELNEDMEFEVQDNGELKHITQRR